MIRHSIERIEVRIQVGDDRMAATDDPIFFGLRGPAGREFRLALAKGTPFRRSSEDHFVLGSSGAAAANVAHPELNDPASPALDAADVDSTYLRKDSEPLPNVRGMGEMDDRIQLLRVDVEIHAAGLAEPRRYSRVGPFWLGLVSGGVLEVPAVATGA